MPLGNAGSTNVARDAEEEGDAEEDDRGTVREADPIANPSRKKKRVNIPSVRGQIPALGMGLPVAGEGTHNLLHVAAAAAAVGNTPLAAAEGIESRRID